MTFAGLNPYVRYMDRRICRYSYKSEVIAYDMRLFFLLEGSCRLVLKNKTLCLSAGDCIIFPPGLVYRFFFTPENPAHMYVINFDLNCERCAIPSLGVDSPDSFRPEHMICPGDDTPFAHPILLRGAQMLEKPLCELLREHEKQSPYHQELCSALLKRILVQALRLQKEEAQAPDPLVREIADYLGAHLSEQVSGEMLSRRFNYHAYYLGKRFRQQMGMSIHQYLISLRIQKCARLLISSAKSVSEIAAECGFASPSYLSEYFRKAYGTTPTAYREKGRMA